MAASIVDIKSIEAFDEFVKNAKNSLVVVHFWADFAVQCNQINEVMLDLMKQYVGVKFIKVEAEELPDLSEKHNIIAVPTIIYIKCGKVLDRLDGVHPSELAKKVEKWTDAVVVTPLNPVTLPKEDINERCKKLVSSVSCMLFMKGTPDEPRCGFSRQIIAILKSHNAQFSSFNILADDEIRQGLKTYSNWPTYPQLYISGELVGGLDIIKEMNESDELAPMLPKIDSSNNLEERLKTLISQSQIMLFMKGSPDHPECGFSRTICSILKTHNVTYGHFNILQDDEVRQELKKYSNWPTYPQLYVNGDLLGGLDIIKEMEESGDLVEALTQTA